MYTDLPKITRCCFCFPLRYGLQIWGYVKLLLETAFLIFALAKTWTLLFLEPPFSSPLPFMLMILTTDIIFSIFLVIATHKKQEKLFKCYYIYSIVMVALMVTACVVDMVFMLITMYYYYHDGSFIGQMFLEVTITNAVMIIGLTLLQVYIILLVRTELHKLRDNSNIQFYNHSADPQVNMTIEKIAVSV